MSDRKCIIKEDYLTGIADAIRSKTGSTDTMLPSEMAEKIEEIESGGGGVPMLSSSASATIPTVQHGTASSNISTLNMIISGASLNVN